jgi:hypothetical protein
MNLLDLLLESGSGGALDKIAQRSGLSANQTSSVLAQLAPALGRALQRNTEGSGGLESLLGALAGGNHQRYVDSPDVFDQPDSVNDGNAILGHLLGSKDVSRNLAGHAANQTGIGADVIKKMLPMVAALAMGTLSKKTAASQAVPSQSQAGSLISGLLDSDRDGSVADDLLNMARKFF